MLGGIGGGAENGNALQYSCLENPTDRGAWWARVHSVGNLVDGLSFWVRCQFLLSEIQVI